MSILARVLNALERRHRRATVRYTARQGRPAVTTRREAPKA
jgi:hypothetical protein